MYFAMISSTVGAPSGRAAGGAAPSAPVPPLAAPPEPVGAWAVVGGVVRGWPLVAWPVGLFGAAGVTSPEGGPALHAGITRTADATRRTRDATRSWRFKNAALSLYPGSRLIV